MAKAIESADQCDAAAVLFNQWPVPGKGAVAVERHQGPSIDGLAFPYCCRDFGSFRQHTDFGNVLFITASLWRLRFFQANVGVFIDYSYSRASQAQIYLLALLSGSACFLVLNEPLINYVYSHRWSRLDYLSRILAIFAEPAVRAQQAAVTDFLWSQCRWAFLSAAHEQVRSGQITLVAWLRVAVRFSFHLLTHEPLSASLPRLIDLWRIPFEIKPPSYYLSLVTERLHRSAVRLLPRRS